MLRQVLPLLAVLGFADLLECPAGTVVDPSKVYLDVIHHQDWSHSFDGDKQLIASALTNAFTGLKNLFPESRFGLVSFIDKALQPGEEFWPWRLDVPLGTSTTAHIADIGAAFDDKFRCNTDPKEGALDALTYTVESGQYTARAEDRIQVKIATILTDIQSHTNSETPLQLGRCDFGAHDPTDLNRCDYVSTQVVPSFLVKKDVGVGVIISSMDENVHSWWAQKVGAWVDQGLNAVKRQATYGKKLEQTITETVLDLVCERVGEQKLITCPNGSRVRADSIHLDVIHHQDASQSFAGSKKILSQEIEAAFTAVSQLFPHSRFGLASFRDKTAFSVDGLYPYSLEIPLTSDITGVQERILNLKNAPNRDGPEAVFDALMYTAEYMSTSAPSAKHKQRVRLLTVATDNISQTHELEDRRKGRCAYTDTSPKSLNHCDYARENEMMSVLRRNGIDLGVLLPTATPRVLRWWQRRIDNFNHHGLHSWLAEPTMTTGSLSAKILDAVFEAVCRPREIMVTCPDKFTFSSSDVVVELNHVQDAVTWETQGLSKAIDDLKSYFPRSRFGMVSHVDRASQCREAYPWKRELQLSQKTTGADFEAKLANIYSPCQGVSNGLDALTYSLFHTPYAQHVPGATHVKILTTVSTRESRRGGMEVGLHCPWTDPDPRSLNFCKAATPDQLFRPLAQKDVAVLGFSPRYVEGWSTMADTFSTSGVGFDWYTYSAGSPREGLRAVFRDKVIAEVCKRMNRGMIACSDGSLVDRDDVFFELIHHQDASASFVKSKSRIAEELSRSLFKLQDRYRHSRFGLVSFIDKKTERRSRVHVWRRETPIADNNIFDIRDRLLELRHSGNPDADESAYDAVAYSAGRDLFSVAPGVFKHHIKMFTLATDAKSQTKETTARARIKSLPGCDYARIQDPEMLHRCGYASEHDLFAALNSGVGLGVLLNPADDTVVPWWASRVKRWQSFGLTSGLEVLRGSHSMQAHLASLVDDMVCQHLEKQEVVCDDRKIDTRTIELDVFHLLDASASFEDDRGAVSMQVGAAIRRLKSQFPFSKFGLGSFVDKKRTDRDRFYPMMFHVPLTDRDDAARFLSTAILDVDVRGSPDPATSALDAVAFAGYHAFSSQGFGRTHVKVITLSTDVRSKISSEDMRHLGACDYSKATAGDLNNCDYAGIDDVVGSLLSTNTWLSVLTTEADAYLWWQNSARQLERFGAPVAVRARDDSLADRIVGTVRDLICATHS